VADPHDVRDRRRFAWLLRLLPASFREDHGREILQIWREDARDRRPRAWTRAFLDTVRIAPREHAAAWMRDGKLAARRLRRSPGFAIAAILTLALGTGAATSVFSLVNAVLLRPLPWRSPETVGLVWPVQPSGDRTWLSYPELEDMRRDRAALRHVAGLTDLHIHFSADGIGHELQALAVSHDLFEMLGVVPILGRTFLADEDRAGAAPAVILSYDVWRDRFGSDPRVVHRTIRLNDRDYAVTGVLPSGFSVLPATSVFPARVDVWVPLETHLASRDRSVRFLHVLARVDGVAGFEQASDELRAYGQRARHDFPAAYPGGDWTFAIVPFATDVLAAARTSLWLLVGLVALVLLMACANVANLLLARAASRRHELALCTALGAGPARLAGELLVEALVLALCGTAVGLPLAIATPAVLKWLDPGALPRLDDAHVDGRVAAFAILLVGATIAIVAAAPLIDRLKVVPAAVLAGRSTARTRRTTRVGRTLVVVQTALATTVIITACFLGYSFVQQGLAPLGFTADRVLTARMTLSPKYPRGIESADFFDAAVDAASRVPGVSAAAAITQLPFSGAMLSSTFLAGDSIAPQRIDADLRGTTPDYFTVAGIRLLEGRVFTRHDTEDSPDVAIVDATFARRLSADSSVLGRRVRWFRRPDRDLEIVGVVGSVRHRSAVEPPRATVYLPHRQQPRTTMFVAAKTIGDPGAMAASIRAAIARVDPLQPFADVMTMDQRVDRGLSNARTSVMLAVVLAAIGLTLALVGLYGVLSVDVAQRVREFGVRIALGAHPRAIWALVLSEGVALTLCGATLGTIAAAVIVASIRSSLYGTTVSDARQYIFGVAIVLLCSVFAYWIPARRASAVDPLSSLRAD
jgi:putative ABC transport system permease protein